MSTVVAALVCAGIAHGEVAGKVLDAVTGRPVGGAVVTDGKQTTTLTDQEGAFQLSGLTAGVIDVMVQHPSYRIFAQASVPLGARVEIRLRPSSIQADPVEVVETSEEDLRAWVRAQPPFRFPPDVELRSRGQELKGLYRVCVAKDGHVSLVAALEPAKYADPYVKEGIANGWEYWPLPRPACFLWRVILRFPSSAPALTSFAPSEQTAPPGTAFFGK